MFRQAKIAGNYFLQGLKARMAYRLDFFVQCLSMLLSDAVGLIVITVILSRTEIGRAHV